MTQKQINISSLSSGVFVPLIVLAGMAIGYFGLWPQMSNLKQAREVLAAKQAEQKDRHTSLSSIEQLLVEVERQQDSLSRLDEALPASPDVPRLLANLEFLAVQSGLILNGIQVEIPETAAVASDTAADTAVKTVMVDLSVSGQYPQLFAFLLNLEQNLRLFDIQNVVFSEAQAGIQTRSFTISLKTYFQNNFSKR